MFYKSAVSGCLKKLQNKKNLQSEKINKKKHALQEMKP